MSSFRHFVVVATVLLLVSLATAHANELRVPFIPATSTFPTNFAYGNATARSTPYASYSNGFSEYVYQYYTKYVGSFGSLWLSGSPYNLSTNYNLAATCLEADTDDRVVMVDASTALLICAKEAPNNKKLGVPRIISFDPTTGKKDDFLSNIELNDPSFTVERDLTLTASAPMHGLFAFASGKHSFLLNTKVYPPIFRPVVEGMTVSAIDPVFKVLLCTNDSHVVAMHLPPTAKTPLTTVWSKHLPRRTIMTVGNWVAKVSVSNTSKNVFSYLAAKVSNDRYSSTNFSIVVLDTATGGVFGDVPLNGDEFSGLTTDYYSFFMDPVTINTPVLLDDKIVMAVSFNNPHTPGSRGAICGAVAIDLKQLSFDGTAAGSEMILWSRGLDTDVIYGAVTHACGWHMMGTVGWFVNSGTGNDVSVSVLRLVNGTVVAHTNSTVYLPEPGSPGPNEEPGFTSALRGDLLIMKYPLMQANPEGTSSVICARLDGHNDIEGFFVRAEGSPSTPLGEISVRLSQYYSYGESLVLAANVPNNMSTLLQVHIPKPHVPPTDSPTSPSTPQPTTHAPKAGAKDNGDDSDDYVLTTPAKALIAVVVILAVGAFVGIIVYRRKNKQREALDDGYTHLQDDTRSMANV